MEHAVRVVAQLLLTGPKHLNVTLVLVFNVHQLTCVGVDRGRSPARAWEEAV